MSADTCKPNRPGTCWQNAGHDGPHDNEKDCDCILAQHPEFEGHKVSEHNDEYCPGSWTFDPPCGGCINCLAVQQHYYADADRRGIA